MRCKRARRRLTDEEMLYLGIQRQSWPTFEIVQELVLKMKKMFRRSRR